MTASHQMSWESLSSWTFQEQSWICSSGGWVGGVSSPCQLLGLTVSSGDFCPHVDISKLRLHASSSSKAYILVAKMPMLYAQSCKCTGLLTLKLCENSSL